MDHCTKCEVSGCLEYRAGVSFLFPTWKYLSEINLHDLFLLYESWIDYRKDFQISVIYSFMIL